MTTSPPAVSDPQFTAAIAEGGLAPWRQPTVVLLWNLVRGERWLLVGWLALNVGAGLLEGTSMGLLYLAVDTLIGEGAAKIAGFAAGLGAFWEGLVADLGPHGLFVAIVSLVAFAQVLQSATSLAGNATAALVRCRARGAVHKRVFAQIVDLPFADVSRFKSGELWSKVTVSKSIDQLVASAHAAVHTALMAIAYAAFLLWLSWWMTLAALAMLGLMTWGLNLVMRRIKALSAANLENTVTLNAQTQDVLGGLRLVRSFGAENWAKGTINGLVDRTMDLVRRGLVWQSVISPMVDTVAMVTVAMGLVAMSLVLGERMADVMPSLLLLMFVLVRLMPRISQLNSLRGTLHGLWPSIRFTVDFLDQPASTRHGSGRQPIGRFKGRIQFRNVSKTYVPGERPAIVDLDLTIERGQTVAFVGQSGAGKSTVIDLLLGLREPSAGEILIDGKPLSDIDKDAWRRLLGVVDQDPFLFHTTIRDNIAFIREDASDADVVAAARVAHAHEFIERLAQGYDTVVGDRGYRLSGGQRQRIALARALLRDPEILILDEATSDLDSLSEHFIQDALEAFGSRRTVILVAHRLSTVRKADVIFVLHEGRLVERGTHDQLTAMDGVYASLWNLQS